MLKRFAPFPVAWFLLGAPGHTEIVPDGSLPTDVPAGCLICTINGGALRGSNLFHSFESFSIPTDGVARFNNNPGVQNILVRITGSNRSTIDGLLQANGRANLFFLNPNGIFFGPNARLDLGGSFVATTARSILFADNSEFPAVPSANNELLTITAPIGLSLQSAAPIAVEGRGHNLVNISDALPVLGAGQQPDGLRVRPGQTLALVGGNVTLNGGSLSASSGRIQLGSIQTGTVQFASSEPFRFFGDRFGDITMTNKSLVDVSGVGGGSIDFHARNLVIDRNTVVINQNSVIPANPVTVQLTGALQISAQFDQVNEIPAIIGTNTIARSLSNNALGGDIVINANQIDLTEGGLILTRTSGPQIPGNISAQANTITITGVSPVAASQVSAIYSATFTPADTGNLQVRAEQIVLSEGGSISAIAYGDGKAGTVDVQSREITLIGDGPIGLTPSTIGSVALGVRGGASPVTIQTEQLTILDGAQITASSAGFAGAGSVSVQALNQIVLDGKSAQTGFPSQISSSVFALPEITNVSSDPLARVVSNLPNLQVALRQTGNIGARFPSGNVNIQTSVLALSNRAEITARQDRSGSGGNLQVQADQVLLSRSKLLSSTAQGAMGGNITLISREILLRDGSEVSASALATGQGGNITISTSLLGVFENSQISATAQAGAGGQISVNAAGVVGTNGITAQSRSGPQGLVQINAPIVNVVVKPEPTLAFAATPIVLEACVQRVGQSSFVVLPQGGLPLSPDQSHIGLGWHDPSTESVPDQMPSTSESQFVEATALRRLPDGGMALVAESHTLNLMNVDCQSAMQQVP